MEIDNEKISAFEKIVEAADLDKQAKLAMELNDLMTKAGWELEKRNIVAITLGFGTGALIKMKMDGLLTSVPVDGRVH